MESVNVFKTYPVAPIAQNAGLFIELALSIKLTDTSQYYFDVDVSNGHFEFVDTKEVFSESKKGNLPKDKSEALTAAKKFLAKSNTLTRANIYLKQRKFPPLFDRYLALVSTRIITHPKNLWDDHWEITLSPLLDSGSKNFQKSPVKDAAVRLKIGSSGNIIGLAYHLLPITSIQNISANKIISEGDEADDPSIVYLSDWENETIAPYFYFKTKEGTDTSGASESSILIPASNNSILPQTLLEENPREKYADEWYKNITSKLEPVF